MLVKNNMKLKNVGHLGVVKKEFCKSWVFTFYKLIGCHVCVFICGHSF